MDWCLNLLKRDPHSIKKSYIYPDFPFQFLFARFLWNNRHKETVRLNKGQIHQNQFKKSCLILLKTLNNNCGGKVVLIMYQYMNIIIQLFKTVLILSIVVQSLSSRQHFGGLKQKVDALHANFVTGNKV